MCLLFAHATNDNALSRVDLAQWWISSLAESIDGKVLIPAETVSIFRPHAVFLIRAQCNM